MSEQRARATWPHLAPLALLVVVGCGSSQPSRTTVTRAARTQPVETLPIQYEDRCRVRIAEASRTTFPDLARAVPVLDFDGNVLEAEPANSRPPECDPEPCPRGRDVVAGAYLEDAASAAVVRLEADGTVRRLDHLSMAAADRCGAGVHGVVLTRAPLGTVLVASTGGLDEICEPREVEEPSATPSEGGAPPEEEQEPEADEICQTACSGTDTFVRSYVFEIASGRFLRVSIETQAGYNESNANGSHEDPRLRVVAAGRSIEIREPRTGDTPVEACRDHCHDPQSGTTHRVRLGSLELSIRYGVAPSEADISVRACGQTHRVR